MHSELGGLDEGRPGAGEGVEDDVSGAKVDVSLEVIGVAVRKYSTSCGMNFPL